MPDRRAALLEQLQPRRVCLVKPSSLGDVAHALPTLAALRAHWPDAHIAWVINRGLRGLVDGHPDLDQVIPFDRGAVRPTWRGARSVGGFLLGLRRERFDLAIDLQGLFRSGVMTAATGAPVKVGLASAREGAPWFYDVRVPTPDPEEHAVDRLLRVASAFGADTSAPRFQAAIRPDDAHWAEVMLRGVPRPRLALNVGARWLTKRWPPARFAAVARRIHAERGAGLVLVGAPEDRPLVDAVLEHLGPIPALDLCGRTNLPQLAAVAAGVDVFLSNDTGPLHLAVAAGADVVGVYTCTSPDRTGPYGPNAQAVRSCVHCAPSYRRTCPDLICMTELTAARVAKAVHQALDRRSVGRAPEREAG